jgi:hypothetical protein
VSLGGYSPAMRWNKWVSTVRGDPKGQMEGDLVIAVVGLVIIVLGGIVAVAGIHPRGQSIHDNAPSPLAGNIIAAAGALLILVGLILATANLVIWLTGRNKPRPLSDDEVLLRKIRDDGHRNRSS